MHWIKGLINLLFCLFVCCIAQLCCWKICVPVSLLSKSYESEEPDLAYQSKNTKIFLSMQRRWRKVHEKSPGMVCRAEIPETGLNDWNVRYESEPPTTKRSGHSHTNENRRQKDYTWKDPHFLAHTQRVMIHPALLMGKKDFSNQNVFHKLCFSMCSAFARSSKPFWAQSSFLFWQKTFFCSVSLKIWHNDLFKAVLTFKSSPLQ